MCVRRKSVNLWVLVWETVGAEVPQFLQNIVGKTFTFQLELTELASDLHCFTYL
ncbi:hypothetical protein YC2023_012490 [Brassica napus]